MIERFVIVSFKDVRNDLPYLAQCHCVAAVSVMKVESTLLYLKKRERKKKNKTTLHEIKSLLHSVRVVKIEYLLNKIVF